MAKQIKGLLYFFLMDSKRSLFIFWGILLSTTIISIALSYFLIQGETVRMVFWLSMPLYIYCSIFGFVTVKQSIPFSIKRGVTRKNLFLGMGLFFIGLAFVEATIVNVLNSILHWFIDLTEISTFTLMHPGTFIDNTWYGRFITDFTVMLFLLAFMFMLGLLFYKYGLLGGGGFAGIIVIFLLFSSAKGWIIQFFTYLTHVMSLGMFLWLALLGAICYAVAWLFIRNITIIKTT